MRGPAALRYGSTSIGGVVSATNNRIPEALPSCPAAPFQSYGLPAKAPLADAQSASCVTVETRTAVSSVDRGVEGGILLDAGGGNFAVHADAYGRKAGDYSIPGYPYLFDQTRPVNGRQPNSAAQADGASVGGSYIFHGGFIGAAITQNDSLYRIPGIDGADHQTRIDAHQTKFSAKGEYRPDAAAIDAIRFWAGATDYKHNEIGLADPADLSSIGVRQTFTNKEQEGRVEVQMAPFNARFAAVTTAFGLQASHQQLTAPSPDDPGSPLNGLWDPNKNTKVAGYVFNEFKFTETTKAQIAGRIEHVDLSGTTPSFIPRTVRPQRQSRRHRSADRAQSELHAEEREHRPDPESAVAIWSPASPRNMSSARPSPRNCFRAARHDATGTFDIGNPNLGIETAKTIEIGLRKATRAVPVRSDRLLHQIQRLHLPSAHRQHLRGFRLRRPCRSGGSARTEPGDLFAARRHLPRRRIPEPVRRRRRSTAASGASRTSSTSCAQPSADGTNVPRIPPVRVGGGLFWRDANWLTRDQPAARLRAERYRPDRRDADRGL